MLGMLADINLQGHLRLIRHSLDSQGLTELLEDCGLSLRTFPDLGLDQDLDDRALWNYCQDEGWALFTDNRNEHGPDSLQATMNGAWAPGLIPVITPSSKRDLEHNRTYRNRVSNDIAGLLIDLKSGSCRDRPRIYVPLPRIGS